MATAGGTPMVRSGGWLVGLLLGIFGCGDRHLTAIKPSLKPQDDAPLPASDCGADVAPAGLRPPMGWNGWNTFGCGPGLDQTKFRANADAMVERGLFAAGYQYMNLDDCWQSGRGADGIVIPNAARFPDGIGALGDYVHGKGLKLGIDTCSAGCQRPELTTPGSQSFEAQDAQSYASWGVDFVKYTSSGSDDDREAFTAMREALDQTGRPMLLSIVDAPFKYWHTEVGQMWRTQSDVEPSWEGILSIVDETNKLAAYAGLRGYNDSDMLWVGNPGLSESESRAHFTMWAILASPLLAGNDLTEMTESIEAILTNREIIALNQDALGLQGALVGTQGEVQIYAKPLSGCGERAVVLLNRGSQPAQVALSLGQLGLETGPASLRDLWGGADLAPLRDSDSWQLTVPGHDVVALRVTGTEPAPPRGEVFLSDLAWSYAANGWGPVERDQELGSSDEDDGAPLTLGGVTYPKGLGTNSPSLVRYRLGKACRELTAEIGIDDLTGDSGSVVFQVWADGAKLFDSGVVYGSTPARHISVDISGRSELRLLVAEVEDFGLDHADWADARLHCDD